MDHDGQPQVIVESLAGKDLAGAMLRRSFSRRPNKGLYWPPLRAVLAAFLTAGLWPSGLLINRLWKYAAHQRFRAGELARWLRAPNPPALEPDRGYKGVLTGDFTWDLIIPRGTFFAVAIVWVAAMGLSFAATIQLYGIHQITPIGRRYDAAMRLLPFAAIGAAAMLQMLLVFELHMRVKSCVDRADMLRRRTRWEPKSSQMPIWIAWPASLALLSIPVKLAGFQVVAMWIVTATAAVLASEIQRGYITVADRRLRLSVARAIGAAMYSEARR